MNLNEKIKLLRVNHLRMNQEEFAESIGVTQAAVSKMEISGSLKTTTIKKIIKEFGVNPEWLMFNSENDKEVFKTEIFYKKGLGNKIKTLRNMRNMKQGELAKLIGVSQASISQLESGSTEYGNANTLVKIAEIFNVDVDSLTSDSSSIEVVGKGDINKGSTGDRIRIVRVLKNVTQQELADMVGVTKAAISDWENNKYVPKIDVLESISENLGASLDWIRFGENESYSNLSLESSIEFMKQRISDLEDKIKLQARIIAMYENNNNKANI